MTKRTKQYLNNKISEDLASNGQVDISVLRTILGDMVDSDFNLEDDSTETLQMVAQFNEANVSTVSGFTGGSAVKAGDELTLILNNDMDKIYRVPRIFDENGLDKTNLITSLEVQTNALVVKVDLTGVVIDPDPLDTTDIFWAFRY